MAHPTILAARSQLPFAPHLRVFFSVLRRADEHLDQVIVQAVEELALEGPLELWIVEIARVQVVVVGVDLGLGKSRTQYHLNAIALCSRTKRDKRMLIELELIEHLGKAVRGHTAIVKSVPQHPFILSKNSLCSATIWSRT